MATRTARCYFWGPPDKRNFGDRLALDILRHFANVDAEWSEPTKANVVAVGSVIDVLPDGWDGVVVGAGTLHAETLRDLRNAECVALRGPLTIRAVQKTGTPTMGDPGLLACELVDVERGKYPLGVVPHWRDATLYRRFKHLDPILIDPTGDPVDVVRQIGSCRKIVASSLHGLIVADSFGIPRRAERWADMTSVHEGGDHKYADYHASLGMPLEWSVHGGQVAPRERVNAMQARLFDALQTAGGLLNV